eukprot:SAG11_NODE_30515_length_300_cov_0.771144_1_plen_55_part_00
MGIVPAARRSAEIRAEDSPGTRISAPEALTAATIELAFDGKSSTSMSALIAINV